MKTENDNIKKILQNREAQMELLINKFRISVLIFISIADFLVLFVVDKSIIPNTVKIGIYELGLTIFALISVSIIQFFAKRKKHYAFLKFYTVTYDLVLTFAFGYLLLVVFDMPFPITKISFGLLLTIFFIFFNMLSILRIGKKIIIYSGVLTLVLNIILLSLAHSPLMPIVYTSFFVVAFTVYNTWVSKYIINFLTVNKQLSSANIKIKQINTDILQQNEEISAQRDEIETQKQKLEISHEKIISSVNYAKRIQTAMLPTEELFNKYFAEYIILFKPKDIVSGDFYWAKKVNNILVIAAADCTGHGVPGAFVSMLGMSLLNEIIINSKNITAGQVLNDLRTSIKTSLKQQNKDSASKDGLDIALCVINFDTNELQFAGAYNPLYIIRNNELIELKADRQPIAIHIKEKDFTNHKFNLQKEDLLYMFSDGYIDQFNGKTNEKFKTKRFKKLLTDNANKSLTKQKQILEQNLIQWQGNAKQLDDIVIIGTKIK